ncbi:MAG: hypothetical protein H5T86_04185 [Armatimonadetes bacterium]|nr:hypothetical protein [Armatimonadota bacterium]
MPRSAGRVKRSELEERLRGILASAKRLRNPSTKETVVHVIGSVLDALGWPEERRGVRYPGRGSRRAYVALMWEPRYAIVLLQARKLGAVLGAADVEWAIRRARARGARWAVLTNGYEWRIYEIDRKSRAYERPVAETDLRALDDAPEKVCDTLFLLSPYEIASGMLSATGVASRAYWSLVDALSDERSFARAFNVSPSLARSALSEALKSLSRTVSTDPAAPASEGAAPAAAEPSRKKRAPRQGPRSYVVSIAGQTVTVDKAKHIVVTAAEYLVGIGKLTPSACPVAVTRGSTYLVNTEPVHAHGGKFLSPERLSNGLFVESYCSASTAVEYSCRLLEQFGLSRDVLKVEKVEA